jgi:hypothetical protein
VKEGPLQSVWEYLDAYFLQPSESSLLYDYEGDASDDDEDGDGDDDDDDDDHKEGMLNPLEDDNDDDDDEEAKLSK